MNEIWKDIPHYKGLYQISNFGKIKGRYGHTTKAFYYTNSGYLMFNLTKNKRIEKKYIHKLVAEAFIPDRTNFKSTPYEDRTQIDLDKLEVNHKDENKQNNCVDNLEWCTHKYNCNYGTRAKKASEKISKKVAQYNLDNVLIKIYKSGLEAKKKTKINNTSISRCCYNKQYTAGGFRWRFINE